MSELIDRERPLKKEDIEFCPVSKSGFYGPSRNPNDRRKSAGKSWRKPFNKYTAAEGRAKNGPVVIIYKPKRKNLADAPAVSVPVVHGRWILLGKNEHDYETSVEEKCSLCGRYVYRYDTELQDNYCPNCGAKMDGE